MEGDPAGTGASLKGRTSKDRAKESRGGRPWRTSPNCKHEVRGHTPEVWSGLRSWQQQNRDLGQPLTGGGGEPRLEGLERKGCVF